MAFSLSPLMRRKSAGAVVRKTSFKARLVVTTDTVAPAAPGTAASAADKVMLPP